MSTDRSSTGHGSAISSLDDERIAVLDSVTSAALSSALDGLAMRQRTIANNIANVNTPNYHAKRVLFEDALAKSVQNGDGRVTAEVARSLEPTELNGNNVNLDTETLSNVDTVLRYQFASQAVGNEFSAVRAAIRTT
ncbi:flagellar basal-body rod protein FlgB [Glaciihabitans sp. UYNi722]